MEQQTWLTGIALRCCDWSERWFPGTYVFAALGVIAVGLLAVVRGSPRRDGLCLWRRLLESDPVHDAEVFHHHWWLRGRVVAAGGAHYRDAGAVAAQRARRGGVCSPQYFEGASPKIGRIGPLKTKISGEVESTY
jgi:hypothetical protein